MATMVYSNRPHTHKTLNISCCQLQLFQFLLYKQSHFALMSHKALVFYYYSIWKKNCEISLSLSLDIILIII